MEENQKNRLRQYAWNYFAYHADQRMKTFHYYLLLVLGLTAAAVSLLARTDTRGPRLAAALCGLVTVLSLLFFILDRRNSTLVKNGENALMKLDELETLARSDDVPGVLEIFAQDAHRTGQMSLRNLRPHISYSDVFRAVFVIFGGLGLVFGLIVWR